MLVALSDLGVVVVALRDLLVEDPLDFIPRILIPRFGAVPLRLRNSLLDEDLSGERSPDVAFPHEYPLLQSAKRLASSAFAPELLSRTCLQSG